MGGSVGILALFAAMIVNLGALIGFVMMAAVVLLGFGWLFYLLLAAVSSKRREFTADETGRGAFFRGEMGES